jgi:hypothetical protein
MEEPSQPVPRYWDKRLPPRERQGNRRESLGNLREKQGRDSPPGTLALRKYPALCLAPQCFAREPHVPTKHGREVFRARRTDHLEVTVRVLGPFSVAVVHSDVPHGQGQSVADSATDPRACFFETARRGARGPVRGNIPPGELAVPPAIGILLRATPAPKLAVGRAWGHGERGGRFPGQG